MAPVGTALGVLRPRAARCGHSHTPPARPSEDTPCAWKLGASSCTTDPRAGSCRGLILRRWRALLPMGSPAWQRPAGVWCQSGCFRSQGWTPPSRAEGPRLLPARSKAHGRGPVGEPLPRGVSSLHGGGKQTLSQTPGPAPSLAPGPRAQSPAQLAPWSQGGVESGCCVNGLSVSCPLNSRGFRHHRDEACPPEVIASFGVCRPCTPA